MWAGEGFSWGQLAKDRPWDALTLRMAAYETTPGGIDYSQFQFLVTFPLYYILVISLGVPGWPRGRALRAGNKGWGATCP